MRRKKKKKKKHKSDTDSDIVDPPPAHKPAPPPKKKTEVKAHITAQDIQIVHLDPVKAEEEIIALPIQTPYYDISASDCEKRTSCHMDLDVQYAELDTSALASPPITGSSFHASGDLVEYATIQPLLH
ncbi:unnamed protein product [Staurois parvus]|uniref:Uncharacterized protein n=1 Tax=Staurois parvus TaxID=386267 RepID=A0ABN9A946_9NEOB|nr:unnamed protein product [Staurois parvus]